MKKYILILCIIVIGCKNETNKLQTNQNQLMRKNVIDNANVFNIDIDSSSIFWIGKKIYKSHNGTLNFHSGNVQIKDNIIVGGNFQVDMNSIICNDIKKENPNKGLVNHLKNEDFFDVKNHPYSFLKIINSEKKSENEYLFLAELTIKNIVQPITFNGYINLKNNKYHFKTNLSFDRTLWNIKYGSGKFFQELGDRAILDEIELEIVILTESNSSK